MGKNINKLMVSQAIISKIKNERNPKVIRALYPEEYESPEQISLNTGSESFVPDIEVVYEKENIVYEIELNDKITVNKWHAFSKYVRKSNGSFYLVVPKQLKEFIKKEMEDNAVNAGVITFGTKSGVKEKDYRNKRATGK
jgi:hypothetical protein